MLLWHPPPLPLFLQDIASVALKYKLDGLVVSNTTITRPGEPAMIFAVKQRMLFEGTKKAHSLIGESRPLDRAFDPLIIN